VYITGRTKTENGNSGLIKFVPDRPGHGRRYALKIHKISCELKWNPTVGLDEGLERTVEWYRTHSD
jgi:dTDP-glucose 4,6-dehydratase